MAAIYIFFTYLGVQQANQRYSVLFYRDLDFALSPDRQLEEHGAEKLQSMQQTPARELKGRFREHTCILKHLLKIHGSRIWPK